MLEKLTPEQKQRLNQKCKEFSEKILNCDNQIRRVLD